MKRRMILVLLLLGLSLAILASAAVFATLASEQFGTSNDVTFVRHIARFQGVTSLGIYDLTFERIAPAGLGRGNDIAVREPPQCAPAVLDGDSRLGEAEIVRLGRSGEISILKEHEAGASDKDLSRRRGVAENTVYRRVASSTHFGDR